MARRRVDRLVQWLLRVGVAVALLSDVPQQLELGSRMSEALVFLGDRVGPVEARGPALRTQVAARAATAVVTGVAWLAVVSLPYAEPYPEP